MLGCIPANAVFASRLPFFMPGISLYSRMYTRTPAAARASSTSRSVTTSRPGPSAAAALSPGSGPRTSSTSGTTHHPAMKISSSAHSSARATAPK